MIIVFNWKNFLIFCSEGCFLMPPSIFTRTAFILCASQAHTFVLAAIYASTCLQLAITMSKKIPKKLKKVPQSNL